MLSYKDAVKLKAQDFFKSTKETTLSKEAVKNKVVLHFYPPLFLRTIFFSSAKDVKRAAPSIQKLGNQLLLSISKNELVKNM